MTLLTISREQRTYRAAKRAYERKLQEITSLVNALLDSCGPLETEEEIEAYAYAEQEAALHQQVGTTQALEDLRNAENVLLSWGLAFLKQQPGYTPEIDQEFSSNLAHIREKALLLCLRINASLMAVFRAQKMQAMPAYSFYYFHTSCWDSWDNRRESPASRSLCIEPIALPDGYLRLVPVEDMAASVSCSACHKSFTAASEA